MTDSSDDSADTVISVLDSRPSQSQSTSDSLSAEDSSPAPQSPDNEKPQNRDVMGNRHGGEKKKKDDVPQDNKPEDKPKKKGKKSKGKSKRNSQNVEGDLSSGHGACASPSSSTAKEKSRPRSKRPDVLADLGAHAPGSPLGSPESASGSQGTWSYDDESDVSTLGYSTPLLSTPQVQRYVLPKQTTPQQNSTERLEELGRSIEKTIIDKLSDKPAEQGATAAPPAANTNRKERRNIKKKRALGQAVIDSDSFQLSLQDVKTVQSENRSPQTQRLNVGTEKISLRASQESPVSPWLRDDDTPVDEEQMDEMFISCIDLSYNLADICSEKEFTEYGSLDSKKRARTEMDRARETSLSPRIARRPVEGNVSPWSKDLRKMQTADPRDTPPKSDSSTSTLAEAGRDTVQEACELDLPTHQPLTEIKTDKQKDTSFKPLSVTAKAADDSLKEAASKDSSQAGTDAQTQVKKKAGKSKSKSKSKKRTPKELAAPIASKESDIPTEPESPEPTEVFSCDQVNENMQENKPDLDIKQENENKEDRAAFKQPVTDKNREHGFCPENISEPLCQYDVKVMAEASDSVMNALESNIAVNELSHQNICEDDTLRVSRTHENAVSINNGISGISSKISDPVPCNIAEQNSAFQTVSECSRDSEQFVKSTKEEPPDKVHKAAESLSPQEPASPKHVPPPSPSAMDALAEIDEDDEEAMEALEENSQLKEVQLFGETVFKRLSSLVESQSQDEDTEERFRDFRDLEDLAPGDTDSPPVNLGSMELVNGDASECLEAKASDVAEVQRGGIGYSSKQIVEEELVAVSASSVEKSIVDRFPENLENSSQLSKKDVTEEGAKDDRDDIVDDGTLKKKKKKSGQKKCKKEQDKSKKDQHGNIVKKPEIPAELKHADNTAGLTVSKSKSDDKKGEIKRGNEESEKENTPPKRESQQIGEVIDAYGLGDIVDVCVERLPSEQLKHSDYVDVRPRYESDDDEEDDDSDSSCNNRSRSTERPSTSSLELSSRQIPDIEETFSELLSVKHILEDFEDRTPTEEYLPTFVSSDELRSPPECVNGRRSRMSPAITDRTESDLDISEQRDDISTDSMYADDEDDGASEVLFSRSYSEPAGNEVVVSCTFYNTQHNNNNNADDSDDFWEDYSTADESFKQIEISADAASSTFQNARKQMHDIHQHLQDLRRQMEYLQEEVESATLTPEYSMDSEEKRPITE